MAKIAIIGGGAAGMMAAASIGAGHHVTVYEKNEKLGKKLFITGKGRCNLTNACEADKLFDSVVTNSRFLYSAFHRFDNQAVFRFFEEAGCPLKTERGGRVFPVSDHASDVTAALAGRMKKQGVRVRLNSPVRRVLIRDGSVTGIQLMDESTESADAVILATGGLSYPSTGSTGDGYRMAKEAGHRLTETSPRLTSLMIKEDFCKRLQGLSLKNVALTLSPEGKKPLYQGFGELLFTHVGVSGPLALSASSYYTDQKGPCRLSLDLKPALTLEQLDRRLCRDFEENRNRQFKNALGGLFPARLIPVMTEQSGILGETPVNRITKAQRSFFAARIKDLGMTVTGAGDYNEAVITRGGVCVKEVNPSTMESRLVKGLYFAGEVLDLDALTGGYNLQIAWSTGYLAGESIRAKTAQDAPGSVNEGTKQNATRESRKTGHKERSITGK